MNSEADREQSCNIASTMLVPKHYCKHCSKALYKDWPCASQSSPSKHAKAMLKTYKDMNCVEDDRLAGSDPTRTLLSMSLQNRQPDCQAAASEGTSCRVQYATQTW